MSDQYLHFPGGAVRRDEVVAVETKEGAAMKFTAFSMISFYALLTVVCLFAGINFIDSLLPVLTGGDGYNDPLIGKIVAFLLFAVIFGVPILLLCYMAQGYKTGDPKYFKRGRWGAALVGGVAAMICLGYFNESGVSLPTLVSSVVTIILAIIVIIPTFSWEFATSHQVVHITLRSGQVLKVDRVGDTPFDKL
jgi:hypothetical protein